MTEAQYLNMIRLIAAKYHGTVVFGMNGRTAEIDVPEEFSDDCAREIAEIVGAVEVEVMAVQ